jgi:anthranilate synthase component 1
MMLPIKEPKLYPTQADFTKLFNDGKSQLVWTTVPADLDTPVSAMLRLMDEKSPCFLLESVEKGEIRGRYSVIGLMPDLIWRCKNGVAEICRSDIMIEPAFKPCELANSPLLSLRHLYEESKIKIPDGLPPMSSGLVGTMGYDMVKFMEDLPSTKHDSINIPESCFIRPKIMVIFDAVTDTIFIITSILIDKNKARGNAVEAFEAAKKRINFVLQKLAAPVPESSEAQKKNFSPVAIADFKSNTSRENYDNMLEKAREYIRAGDIFQVVLSQRFSAKFPLPPFALYRALRRLNPSPFLFYLHLGS